MKAILIHNDGDVSKFDIIHWGLVNFPSKLYVLTPKDLRDTDPLRESKRLERAFTKFRQSADVATYLED